MIKQKTMNLEFKHIASNLPYGLKAADKHGNVKEVCMYQVPFQSGLSNPESVSLVGLNLLLEPEKYRVDTMRPILRPLSQLTEKISHNGEEFVPLVRLYEMAVTNIYTFVPEYEIELIGYEEPTFGIVTRDIDDRKRNGFTLNVPYEFGFRFEFDLSLDNEQASSSGSTLNQYELFQKLHEWHFDVSNLIGNDLAYAVTEELNPYK
jgi:hypothetical protein